MKKKIVFVCLIILVISLANNRKLFIYEKLKEWKVIPLEETLTELYFDNHIFLPNSAEKGENIEFSFVIHNLEDREMNYIYQIFFTDENNVYDIDKNEVKVQIDESEKVFINFNIPNQFNRGIVSVLLTNNNQEIHFILNNNKK